MKTRPYRPYQGTGRWGSPLLLLGGAVLAASLLFFLLAPFSLQKFAAFPAALGGFLAGQVTPEGNSARLGRRWLLGTCIPRR